MTLFLKPDQAAAELGVSKRKLMRSDAPRISYGPRTIRFRRESLMEWAKRNETAAAEEQKTMGVVLRMVDDGRRRQASPQDGGTRARLRPGRTVKERGVEATAKAFYCDLIGSRGRSIERTK